MDHHDVHDDVLPVLVRGGHLGVDGGPVELVAERRKITILKTF